MDSGSERFIDPVDGTVWRVDMEFMASGWQCLWGCETRGGGILTESCQGILDRRAPELEQGCCSVGAEVLPDEAGLIEALGLSLDPARFQYASAAEKDGVFTDSSHSATRVLDGACIFFNRPGFAGGVGCALHLAALDDDERPMDYKPAICWQLPLKVEVEADGIRQLRRWRESDWGDEPLAWCCTDHTAKPNAFRGEIPVAESLFDELRAVVGPEVAVEIRNRVRTT